jgi:hypothetical protein
METDSEINNVDELKIETFSTPPTVHQFQMALLDRMKKYGGGIEGVWKAISPNLKYESSSLEGITSVRKLKPRISIDAFRKQVTRLKKESQTNEKMSFGMRGNILLLMNVLEILNVKNTADLIGSPLLEPDLTSLLIETNVNVESLYEKVNKLNDSISLSMRKKPRIPHLKVCRDWEQILIKSKWIVDMPTINNPQMQENILWDFASILGSYASQFSNQKKLAIYICTLFTDYIDYFVKDILLHRYCETFNNLSFSNYSDRHRYIFLAHLYLLYFFLLCHKRYLSIFIAQEKTSNNVPYRLFEHRKHNINGNEIISERVLNILDEKSLIEYIYNKNKEMQNYIKKILLVFEDDMPNLNVNIYNDFLILMNDIISCFFNIYNSKVNFKQSDFFDFVKEIKSLNDLYRQLSLGRPLMYYISETEINNIISFQQRIELLLSSLSRL